MGEVDLSPQNWPNHPGGGWGRTHHGAASELQACAALLKAGYHVFRSETPSAPFDLVAYKNGKLVGVEVKSLTMKSGENADGVKYAPVFSWPSNGQWDLLIVVAPERVFCFDSKTTQPEARDALRRHYGYVPKDQWVAEHPGMRPDLAMNSKIAELLEAGVPPKEIAQQCECPVTRVQRIRTSLLRGTSHQCGTVAGYKLHLSNNEDPEACDLCATAHRKRMARRRTPDPIALEMTRRREERAS